MHDVLHLYTDYRVLFGGIGIGVMALSGIISWFRPPNESSDELHGAYRLWSVYLMAGAVLSTIIMIAYISGSQ